MQHRIFSLVVFVCMATVLMAQPQYEPPNIPDKAIKELQQIVLASKAGEVEPAILKLNELIHRYPDWIEPHHELSRLYYESGRKTKAIAVLQQSIALDTASQLRQLYSLGRLYEETDDIENATKLYKIFIAKSDVSDPLRSKAQNSLDQFVERQEMMKRSYSIDLNPLDIGVNTDEHEAVGRWTLDGSQLYFQRLIGGQEDIYIASYDSTAQKWKTIPFTYNTTDNEGAPAISPDGRMLVFTSCNRRDAIGGCDLYISFFKNGIWTPPVNMGPGFNTPSWEGQAAFGMDGTTIYFSSNRAGGFGGRDIWYMYRVSGDSWSRPISAGPGINTEANEGSPFVYFDDQTMYFMRDGKNGMGGLDIYFAKKGLDDKWQTAENMGPPINTSQDEGALAVSPDGSTAVITKMTPDHKTDLYVFDLPDDFISAPQQALQVNIHDKISGKPIQAQLEIFEPTGDPAVRLTQWSNDDGRLSTALQRNTTYGIIANSPGYVMYSTNIETDSAATQSLTIEMIPMSDVVNEVITLENIFFETGSSQILPASEPELQRLLYMLKTNKTMTIEIRGHTDNVGEESSNLELSQMRAKSVYNYIVQKGIASSRLSYKGFGELIPIAANDTAEGRKKNRRTEFVILTK